MQYWEKKILRNLWIATKQRQYSGHNDIDLIFNFPQKASLWIWRDFNWEVLELRGGGLFPLHSDIDCPAQIFCQTVWDPFCFVLTPVCLHLISSEARVLINDRWKPPILLGIYPCAWIYTSYRDYSLWYWPAIFSKRGFRMRWSDILLFVKYWFVCIKHGECR